MRDELRKFRALECESPLLDYLFDDIAHPQNLIERSLLYAFIRIYGDDENLLDKQLSRLSALCERFLKLYGDGSVFVLRAPARINILGEHVDYVSYLPTSSLTFGSREHDMLLLCRVAQSDRVRGASMHEAYTDFDFALSDGPAIQEARDVASEWLSYLYSHPAIVTDWSNYVKGAVFFARLRYSHAAKCGFDFVIDSTIPPGSGASSSSALVVLAGASIRHVNRIEYTSIELAKDSAQAEWYVGTRGGAMDHLTICLAQPHHALHISYDEAKPALVPLPRREFRWLTFFTHAADKGREVRLEYNERAAVSSIIIPRIIEEWARHEPQRYEKWNAALADFRAGSTTALNALQQALETLPVEISLKEIESIYPDAFDQVSRAFPALAQNRDERWLKVRERALHHLGEVRRVAAATRALRDISGTQSARSTELFATGMHMVGKLLDESHESLKNFYEVCSAQVNQLVEALACDAHIYGMRLMGAGFGGNVLVLTSKESVPSVIARAQKQYYELQGRDGLQENSIIVSTSGAGLSMVNTQSVQREALTNFNAMWWKAERYQKSISALLDNLDVPADEAQAVIVAAGQGARALSSGLNIPKPLASICGVPAIMRVLRTIQAAAPSARAPVVIVSPETERDVRQALSGENVRLVVQPKAFGTGDAIWCAEPQLRDFGGRLLIVWGTQPVIRVQTVARTLKLAALFSNYAMVLPTAVVRHPYAPLRRDHLGQVVGSRETHLEKAASVRFGETNIGLFVVESAATFDALRALRGAHWLEDERRYDRPGGELGFPNEVITRFSQTPCGVLASPIADWREPQGIKTFADVALCERFILELT